MFLVNRTLRSFRTSALHPFWTRALRPLPIAQPLAYYASKRVFHSEFAKAGLGTKSTTHPKASQVIPATGEEVWEEDKTDLRPQAPGPGDIHEPVAILLAVKQHTIGGGPSLEKGVKELEPELKKGTGGSEVELNQYMKWLGRNIWMMVVLLVGLGGIALYDYFYHHLKLEREIDEYMEGVFKRNANYRAQIAEDRKVIQTERELRESSERK